jgi:hypothetical protein
MDLPPRRSAPIRTAEDTVALVHRLAAHYPDAVIAGILNRQERRTAYGHRFTANLVNALRRHWNIPNLDDMPVVDDMTVFAIGLRTPAPQRH